MHTPDILANEPLPQPVQIFLPGMQLETGLESYTERETGESVTIQGKSDRERLRKRKGEDAGRRPRPTKKPKHHDGDEGDDSDPCARLHPLQDYLAPGLDVVFCGINPGRMSAETGHHFANPTNHFWRCLHRSGMTTTSIPPSEDFTLPERFNIGLTNLVDRPSTQANELSRAEMVASVPSFLDKLARYRPRYVCFVGMVIWEVVRNGLVKLQQQGATKRKGKGKGKGREKNQMGLQPYKLAYGNTQDLSRETLLFVVPCTSGRVVQYQLSDKIALFTELQTLVKKPSSEIDTSRMERVLWPSSS